MVGTIIAVAVALFIGIIFGALMASNGNTYEDENIDLMIENEMLKHKVEKMEEENKLLRSDVAKMTEYMSTKVCRTEFIGRESVDTAIEHIEAQRQEILKLEAKLEMATEYIEKYGTIARKAGDDSPKFQILADLEEREISHNPDDVKCDRCDGTGIVTVESADSGDEGGWEDYKCSKCNGTGKVPEYHNPSDVEALKVAKELILSYDNRDEDDQMKMVLAAIEKATGWDKETEKFMDKFIAGEDGRWRNEGFDVNSAMGDA
jgi:excinuclease UvrABC ATPase subunit